ncbi:MAG: hypothetical protein PHN44_07315 [Candidatus Marinimicrobia bacterium]|nr:hypothetical protein [Candidatus Neomarinimicrobiota bacterium]MDD5265150.1 hypothetical protein [Candidatus Bipolaricaulis sp.]
MSDYEIINIDKWTRLQLDEYNGILKIVEGWENRDGEFKPSFCKREFGGKDNRTEKTAPVAVKLGDKATAIEALVYMLYQLTGDQYRPQSDDPILAFKADESDDDSVPF